MKESKTRCVGFISNCRICYIKQLLMIIPDIEDLPKSGPVEDYDEELYKEFLNKQRRI